MNNRELDEKIYYGYIRENVWIHREFLLNGILKAKKPLTRHFKFIFNRADFINLILPLLLASFVLWLNFYWVTILILCFIFFLLYFYIWNSTTSSIEKSIDSTYNDLIFLNRSYIKLLRESLLIQRDISNLPEINSNIIANVNDDISYKLLSNINYNLRDYSLLNNNYFILPFLNYIQFQKKIIKKEYILLNLVKDNLNLRRILTSNIIKNFKLKKKNYLNSYYLNKYSIILFFFIKIIFNKPL